MNEVPKIAKINFMIYFIYLVIFRLIGLNNELMFQMGLSTAFVICGHFIILVIVGITQVLGSEKAEGKARILTSLAILLMGMPLCFGVYLLGGK
jgi:hypothetical protein